MELHENYRFLWGGVVLLSVVLIIGPWMYGVALGQTQPSHTGTDVEHATVISNQGLATKPGYVISVSPTKSVNWRYGTGGTYFDVDHLGGDEFLITKMWRNESTECGQFTPPCHQSGAIHWSQSDGVTWKWTMPIRDEMNSEVHDTDLLPSGELAVVDMEHERVLFVSQEGKVTWQWNASSMYDTPADPTKTDWLHINDIDRLDDGRYLISVRNANQLLILERGEGVVEVINKDGDPDILNNQHNPQWLGNGTVLVADSHNDRIVELTRSSNGEWEVTWTLYEAGGTHLSWPRDADRLSNGNTLITDTRNNRVVEVDESGSIVWEYTGLRQPYEADRLPGDEANASVAPSLSGDSPLAIGQKSIALPLSTTVFAALSSVVALPMWASTTHVSISLVGVGILSLLGAIHTVQYAKRRLSAN